LSLTFMGAIAPMNVRASGTGAGARGSADAMRWWRGEAGGVVLAAYWGRRVQQMGGSMGGEGAAILGVFALWALTIMVFYMIIKTAVKHGVREALEERDAERDVIGAEPFTREG
jgi:hypothetical protein